MADDTGKTTPGSDSKAAESPATKTGPVKPPVLEGTARTRPADKPGDSTAKPTTDRPASAAPPPRSESVPTWMAGIVGGALGLGAAYGLAWFGLWPQPAPISAPADPRIAQFASTIPELETVTGTVQDELATLTSRVASMEGALADGPEATGPDPALTEQLAELSARLDALAAATPEPAEMPDLSALEAEFASLKAETTSTAAELAEARQQLASLTETTAENAGADAATIRLPLIFSGLESAFTGGRSFETELAALRQALPQVLVPESVAGRAASGLPRPEIVQSQLQAALPDMLAGRPISASANWQDVTTDWFRGLVAMRPTGAVEGNSPDAVIARLEAAVAARDFVAAEAELASLPQTMRRAAEPFAADLQSLAAAQGFLAQLRAQVLAGGNGA